MSDGWVFLGVYNGDGKAYVAPFGFDFSRDAGRFGIKTNIYQTLIMGQSRDFVVPIGWLHLIIIGNSWLSTSVKS